MTDDRSKIPAVHDQAQDAPRVIAERPDWMVIAKPAGWHSVARKEHAADDAAKGPPEPTIEEWLRQTHPAQAALREAGLVHRLDLGTSGCIVAARTAAAYERLRVTLGTTAAHKTYLALAASGLPETGSFRLYFSSRHKGSRKVTVGSEGSAPECGRCRWRVMKRAVDGGHDLVEVDVVGRGRRHQVRAGLAHLGHPLRGDSLYGGDTAREAAPALHAWKVEIEGQRIQCEPDARFTAGPSAVPPAAITSPSATPRPCTPDG